MPRPSLQVDNAGYLRLVWSLGGQPYAVNVYGFTGTATAPPTEAMANAVAARIESGYVLSGLIARQHSSVTLTEISLRDISRPNQPAIPGTVANASGTNTGNMLPLQVAFVVTLRTDLAGRRFRGRNYVPGFGADSNDPNGAATVATGSACVSWTFEIRTALQQSGYTMAVISRPVWTETPPGSDLWVLTRAGAANPVRDTGGVTFRDLVWDTQRRRLTPGI